MADLIMTAMIPGLIIGIIFGIVLQRGRFCMNSAFRDILVLKDYTLLKAVSLAIFIEMILFHLMDILEIIDISPKPFAWGGNVLGGFIFGMGMVLAAGCASGTTYRVGEGMMGSLMALMGFAFAAYTAKLGYLSIGINQLRADTLIKADDDKSALTLGNLLGTADAELYTNLIVLIITIVGLVLIVWKYILPWKNSGGTIDFSNLFEKIFKGTGWKWWVTGTVIGLIGAVAFISSTADGRSYPLGITGGWIGVWKFFLGDIAITWEGFLVIGVVVGALIASLIAGEFKLRAPKDGKALLTQFTGGLMMGVGAITAAGCNIGNTLSGVPQLSIGSIVSTVFIILGCWFLAYILFMREE